MAAAQGDSAHIVRQLLQAGADVNHVNSVSSGSSVYILVCMYYYLYCIHLRF